MQTADIGERVVAGVATRCIGHGGQFEISPEGRALARFAAHTDIAVHQLRQLSTDVEAESGAAIFAVGRRAGLRVGLEQTLERILADADAGVDHFEAIAVGADLSCVERHAPGHGELERIGQQVVDDLTHPHRVAEHRARQSALGLVVELQPSRCGDRRVGIAHAGEQRLQVEDDVVEFHATRFDARHVEHLRHQLGHLLAAGDDLVEVPAPYRVTHVCRPGEFSHAKDGVERGAQLVVDGGKELGLGPVGITLALGQRLRCPAALLFGGVALLDDATILGLELAGAQ